MASHHYHLITEFTCSVIYALIWNLVTGTSYLWKLINADEMLFYYLQTNFIILNFWVLMLVFISFSCESYLVSIFCCNISLQIYIWIYTEIKQVNSWYVMLSYKPLLKFVIWNVLTQCITCWKVQYQKESKMYIISGSFDFVKG